MAAASSRVTAAARSSSAGPARADPKALPGRRLVETTQHPEGGNEQRQHAVADDPGERGTVEPLVAAQPLAKAQGQRLEAFAFVIAGDDLGRRLLDRAVDGADIVLLDDILAKRSGDDPDQRCWISAGSSTRAMHGSWKRSNRRLRAITSSIASAATRSSASRTSSNRKFLAFARPLRLPEAMLLDPADEDRGQLGIAQRLGPFEDRQRDRNMGRGQSGVKRLVRLETGRQAHAQIVLDRADQPRQEPGRGEALPLGESGLFGEQKVSGGDGKALARRGQQQPRSVALPLPSAGYTFGHQFLLAAIGLNCR
jgi:hypothetical protein